MNSSSSPQYQWVSSFSNVSTLKKPLLINEDVFSVFESLPFSMKFPSGFSQNHFLTFQRFFLDFLKSFHKLPSPLPFPLETTGRPSLASREPCSRVSFCTPTRRGDGIGFGNSHVVSKKKSLKEGRMESIGSVPILLYMI